MKPIPKPQHCGQNWLDMAPTTGGRICGQCDKVIVDFTSSTWAEIEQVQRANNNSVCGMYTPQQLAHWGHAVPSNGCSKLAATTAMLVAMGITTTARAQTPSASSDKTVIYGTVKGKMIDGQLEPLMTVTIKLKGSTIGTLSDVDGNFQIDLPPYWDTIAQPTLVFSTLEYESLEIPLSDVKKGRQQVDAVLSEAPFEVTAFSVLRPTFWQRVKWRFRKWFGRNA